MWYSPYNSVLRYHAGRWLITSWAAQTDESRRCDVIFEYFSNEVTLWWPFWVWILTEKFPYIVFEMYWIDLIQVESLMGNWQYVLFGTWDSDSRSSHPSIQSKRCMVFGILIMPLWSHSVCIWHPSQFIYSFINSTVKTAELAFDLLIADWLKRPSQFWLCYSETTWPNPSEPEVKTPWGHVLNYVMAIGLDPIPVRLP